MRLDHFIAKSLALSERHSRMRIIGGKIKVDGLVTTDHRLRVSKFSRVESEDAVLKPGLEPLYLMFNKPRGILSATRDGDHCQRMIGTVSPSVRTWRSEPTTT